MNATAISNYVDENLNSLWTYLLDNYSETQVFCIFPLTSLMTCYFLYSGLILALEHSGIMENYKIQKGKTNSNASLWKCLKNVIFTFIVIALPSHYFSLNFMTHYLGFSTSRVLPKIGTILSQFFAFIILEDFSHYWLHRFLHFEFIYPYIHYQHHEFEYPTALSSNYAHPAEVAILGFCTIFGPLIFRPHLFVFLMWMHLRQFLALETHTGHEFPFSLSALLPGIYGGAKHHDLHHKKRKFNFSSSLAIWDRVFGTEAEVKSE